MKRLLLSLSILLILTGCAGPRPILYPNDHLRAVGQEAAERDIAECRELAKAAGTKAERGKTARTVESSVVGAGVGAAAGAAGGAAIGSPGRGAAFGAASGATGGLLRGLFGARRPSPAYTRFVNRCLTERGYEPIGWE
jgi:hypothetical protein